jgi:hypothetical protein
MGGSQLCILGKLQKKGRIERYAKSVVAMRIEKSSWITQTGSIYFYVLK